MPCVPSRDLLRCIVVLSVASRIRFAGIVNGNGRLLVGNIDKRKRSKRGKKSKISTISNQTSSTRPSLFLD